SCPESRPLVRIEHAVEPKSTVNESEPVPLPPDADITKCWPKVPSSGAVTDNAAWAAGFTVTSVLPWLPLCVPSPPYVPVIVCVPVPTALGVYVTEVEQVLGPAPVPLRVHVPVKLPLPFVENETVPVG